MFGCFVCAVRAFDDLQAAIAGRGVKEGGSTRSPTEGRRERGREKGGVVAKAGNNADKDRRNGRMK